MASRQAVVESARDWLKTPWRHQMSAKGTGCDCIGLVVGVARELGLDSEKLPPYKRDADGETLTRLLDERLDRIASSEAMAGDIAVMRFDKYPTHLAIIGEHPFGLSVIHASVLDRKVVEHRIDAKWRGRIIGYYRFRGLDG